MHSSGFSRDTEPFIFHTYVYIHTYTHTHMCVCMCVCVCTLAYFQSLLGTLAGWQFGKELQFTSQSSLL